MELNLSYNSLAEYLKMNVSQQNISLSEILNPLVTRAKLYSNPLFRQDMMTNDKLVRWGKGMLRKTKQMATILATPTSNSPREQAASWTAPQRFSFQDPQAGQAGQAGQSSQSPQSLQSDEDIQIAPPTRHGSMGRDEPRAAIQLSRARSEGIPDEHRKNGTFFARLFKPKKAKDLKDPKDAREEGRLSRRNSSRSTSSTEMRERSSFRSSLPQEEPVSMSFDPHAHTPKPVRRSHKLYRSYSDDFLANENRIAVDGCPHDSLSNVLSEVAPAPEDESVKRLWLNVNAPAPVHWVREERSSRCSDGAWGLREHHGYVSPPPARAGENGDDEMGEFVSLDPEEGGPQNFDFDVFMGKSPLSVPASRVDDCSRDLVGWRVMRV